MFKEQTPKTKKKKREFKEEPVEEELIVGMYNILLYKNIITIKNYVL